MARGEARWRTWQLVAACTATLVVGLGVGLSGASNDEGALKAAEQKAAGAEANSQSVNARAIADRTALDQALRATSTRPAPTTATTTTLPPTTLPPTTTTEPGPKTSFGDGNYRVGVDIAPGTYRSTATSTNCYWKRLSNFTGDDDIIANYLSNSPTTVTILASDKGFQTSRCGTWNKV